MTSLTVNLCFQLDSEKILSNGGPGKLEGLASICLDSPSKAVSISGTDGDTMFVCSGANASCMTMHLFKTGLLTVDIQHFHPDKDGVKTQKTQLKYEYIQAMQKKMTAYFRDLCQFSRSLLLPIQRGKLTPYAATGNDLLREVDATRLLYETNSAFQNIKVYETEDFGNVLFLDDDIMIGEADLIYTETILGLGRNDFRDKTVLILGGGDGGLIHELLKENPKYVLMVEIDIEVINACKEYLPRVCGDSMDQLEGENYKVMSHKIRIDNCLTVLKESIESKAVYDYVVNDLPERILDEGTDTETGYYYDFETSSNILEMAMTILSPNGKYLSRGDVTSVPSFQTAFEEDITSLGFKFKRFNVNVPSFQEEYCTYEVQK